MCFTGYVTHLEVADLRVTYVCSKATAHSHEEQFFKGERAEANLRCERGLRWKKSVKMPRRTRLPPRTFCPRYFSGKLIKRPAG